MASEVYVQFVPALVCCVMGPAAAAAIEVDVQVVPALICSVMGFAAAAAMEVDVQSAPAFICSVMGPPQQQPWRMMYILQRLWFVS
jgi:hypothetical protein